MSIFAKSNPDIVLHIYRCEHLKYINKILLVHFAPFLESASIVINYQHEISTQTSVPETPSCMLRVAKFDCLIRRTTEQGHNTQPPGN